MIEVNRPFLPPEGDYKKMIEKIWKRKWLTNNGPNVKDLELKLKNYLHLDNLPVYVSNGTIALQIALRSLNLKGEIITTPFSYVATASSIVWEHCKPVFVDIDEHSFNIKPTLIQEKITNSTTAILATHVFGCPCDIEELEKIALSNNVKLVFDASHCFGVRYMGKSIFEYGDVSTTSLHATKVYHSIEGGLIFTTQESLVRKFQLMRNFGHDGPYKFSELGINGKNSEFHAAMGLINLKYIEKVEEKRRKLVSAYRRHLNNLPIKFQSRIEHTTENYAYMPILFNSKDQLERTATFLEERQIYSRRYFYPLLDQLPYLSEDTDLNTARQVSECILCLPLYFDLDIWEVDLICEVIHDSFRNSS